MLDIRSTRGSAGRFQELPIIPRIEAYTKIVKRGYITPCWEWTGSTRESNRGRYGRIHYRGRDWKVSRLVYKLLVGPLINGLVIDHLCKNTMCHNPGHLEQVTQRVNNLRSSSPSSVNAGKTHCIKGHEFNEENTYVRVDGRRCRTCRRDNARQRRAA